MEEEAAVAILGGLDCPCKDSLVAHAVADVAHELLEGGELVEMTFIEDCKVCTKENVRLKDRFEHMTYLVK